jgi:hypothetical protein
MILILLSFINTGLNLGILNMSIDEAVMSLNTK